MLQFAHMNRAAYPGGVFWILADGPNELRDSFAGLVDQLGMSALIENRSSSPDVAAAVGLLHTD
jgi:hypothetical protein